MPNELSGGMRKRAGFARALVLDPAIVMFDEPDSGLDPVRTALLCELIREIHEENGGCYMVISHDLGTARRIADFIAVLWKGKIVESGPSDELFNSDNEFVSPVPERRDRGPARDGLDGAGCGPRASALTSPTCARRPANLHPMRNLLSARIAAWAVRAAGAGRGAGGRCSSLVGAVGRARGSRPTRGTDALVDSRLGRFDGDRGLQRAASATSRSSILVEGDLQQLVLTEDLGTLLALEGCLAGNAPGGKVFADEPAPAPCARARRARSRRRSVFGPATFLNQTAITAEQLLRDQTAGGASRRRARPRARRRERAREQGLEAEQQQAAAQAAGAGGADAVPAAAAPARGHATARPGSRASTTRPTSAGRLRPAPAGGHAEGALRASCSRAPTRR